MRLIIAGSRSFTDYEFLRSHCDLIIAGRHPIEIVNGGCGKGVDAVAHQWAINNHYPLRMFFADWNTHGKAAGPIRNKEMADYATDCIVFWDGKSRGSKNMIDNWLKKQGTLKLDVILGILTCLTCKLPILSAFLYRYIDI